MGEASEVSVKVMTTPRLLSDLIAAALDRPSLHRWSPGDAPALVTIVNSDPRPTSDSRVTIVLGDRLDDPVTVIVDGRTTLTGPTRPHELHDLVLSLVRTLPPGIGAELLVT